MAILDPGGCCCESCVNLDYTETGGIKSFDLLNEAIWDVEEFMASGHVFPTINVSVTGADSYVEVEIEYKKTDSTTHTVTHTIGFIEVAPAETDPANDQNGALAGGGNLMTLGINDECLVNPPVQHIPYKDPATVVVDYSFSLLPAWHPNHGVYYRVEGSYGSGTSRPAKIEIGEDDYRATKVTIRFTGTTITSGSAWVSLTQDKSSTPLTSGSGYETPEQPCLTLLNHGDICCQTIGESVYPASELTLTGLSWSSIYEGTASYLWIQGVYTVAQPRVIGQLFVGATQDMDSSVYDNGPFCVGDYTDTKIVITTLSTRVHLQSAYSQGSGAYIYRNVPPRNDGSYEPAGLRAHWRQDGIGTGPGGPNLYSPSSPGHTVQVSVPLIAGVVVEERIPGNLWYPINGGHYITIDPSWLGDPEGYLYSLVDHPGDYSTYGTFVIPGGFAGPLVATITWVGIPFPWE